MTIWNTSPDWQDYLIWCDRVRELSKESVKEFTMFSDDLVECFMDGLTPQEAINIFQRNNDEDCNHKEIVRIQRR